MTANEKTLATFETRIRQMILRFQELKKENQELYGMLEKNEQAVKQLRAKLEQQQNDYNSLKMAKMMEIPMATSLAPRIGCRGLSVTSTSALQSSVTKRNKENKPWQNKRTDYISDCMSTMRI